MTSEQSPLLDHCPPSLPGDSYFDENWYAREQRLIWQKEWVYAGRLNDLPIGKMRPLTIGNVGIILCRLSETKIAAYHNICRHRGSELCRVEQPLGKTIVCPYHAWSYAAADGRLVSTAHATPTADFNREENGLFPVATMLWNGFVFINAAEEPSPFMPDLGLEAYDNWPMTDLVTGHKFVRNLNCNWKVFWENYNECLHCPSIHPELSNLVPIYREGLMSETERQDWSPGKTTGNALKEGALTWTLDGQPCGPIFPDLTEVQIKTAANFVTIYPTAYIVAHVDYVRIVSLVPTSPETTQLTAEWLFSPAAMKQTEFDPSEVAAFASIVLEQDAEAAEMNQRGLRSPRFEAGRLMPQEFYIHHFHEWVRQRLNIN